MPGVWLPLGLRKNAVTARTQVRAAEGAHYSRGQGRVNARSTNLRETPAAARERTSYASTRSRISVNCRVTSSISAMPSTACSFPCAA